MSHGHLGIQKSCAVQVQGLTDEGWRPRYWTNEVAGMGLKEYGGQFEV